MSFRQSIGESLGHQIHAVETAVDASLHETATLAALLPQARIDAGLSAVVGQGVFDSTAAALTDLTRARGHLVRTHAALAALARRLGLDTLAAGPLDKPDDRPPVGGIRPAGGFDAANSILNKTLPGTGQPC